MRVAFGHPECARGGRPALRRRAERGSGSLMLALISLFGTVILAGPMLGRVSLGLQTPSAFSPLAVSSGAGSAAEHALWRIEHDAGFLDSLTGSPPSATYTLELPGGTATITVTASSEEPADEGLSALLTVAPGLVPPGVPTTVDYTLRVVNDDTVAHEISRVAVDPRVFDPEYVPGSTSGFTDADPTYSGGRWWWNPLPYAVVGPFGAETSMSWQMVVDEPEGTYWTAAAVRIEGVGTIPAPYTASVRVANIGALDMLMSVQPGRVSAGPEQFFDYRLVVTNSGADPLTLKWIKQYSSRDFDYVSGSTQGITTADPRRNHDVINDRWEHTWDVEPTPLGPGSDATLTFRMRASLLPGTYFSVGSAKVLEDPGGGKSSTVSTGETAPVSACRSYDIHVELNGQVVDVGALLGSGGVEVLSWVES